MGDLESALDLLRPLILESNSWDYCVVWKLSDDPSGFIEWVGCCCNGSGNLQEIDNKGIKRENDNMLVDECRDVNCVHPTNTKSCQALSRLPPFMSLYSGVHGEVAISSQPRWVHRANAADSQASNEESEGTRVLIPVVGGMIELFSTEHIPENESIVEFIRSQFNSSETETISNSTITFDGPYIEPLLEKTSDTCLSSLNQFNILPITFTMIPITHTHGECTMDGSSTGSFPSDEQPSPDSTYCSVPQTQKMDKKQCKSKNLLTERKRRKKISDGMLTLRSIVPKITKMNKAATLSDAIDYITELNDEARNFLDELEDSDNSYDLNDSCLNQELVEPRGVMTLSKKQLISCLTKSPKSQVKVEVNELGFGNYLVRVVCQNSPGVFTKLVEALASLEVLIDDVNSTICNDTISSNFIVQTNNKEVQEKDLRESLMLLDV